MFVFQKYFSLAEISTTKQISADPTNIWSSLAIEPEDSITAVYSYTLQPPIQEAHMPASDVQDRTGSKTLKTCCRFYC